MKEEMIEKLMVAMNAHHIHRLEFTEKDFSLTLERGEKSSAPVVCVASEMPVAPPVNRMAHPAPVEDKSGVFVTAPIVGTFYASPSPTEPHFVKIGQVVTPDTIVCIIEAMKVMNEVKAGVSGTVAEMFVKNGDPVEFGTKMLRIT